MSRLKGWIGRVGCGVLVLVWLSAMLFPLLAFTLSSNGQVRLGPQDGTHLRLFLVQEKTANGVGAEWTGARRGADGLCRQTRVNYLLWEGEGAPASYCTCLTTDGLQTNLPTCPP